MNTIFHALADDTRRSIVKQLSQGAASVGELAKGTSMSLPSFLKHIKVLTQSGLIRSEKKGRVRICTLRAEKLRLAEDWLEQQRQVWLAHTDRFENYLNTMEEPQ